MSVYRLIVAAVFGLLLHNGAQAQSASIRADFQPVVDGTITIAEAVLPADGFLVVRLPKDNKPFYGPVLAALALSAGTHTDIAVKLDPAPKPDDTLGIILHKDDGTIGTYEFKIGEKTDEPFFNGRRPVIEVIGVLAE